MSKTKPEQIDGLFISYFEDIDRWTNDHAPSSSGPTGSPIIRTDTTSKSEDTMSHRAGQQSVSIDGDNYNLSRFLSLANYGSTIEYRRYDAFSSTHLSGSYYESLARRHGFNIRHANHTSRVDLERMAPTIQPRFIFLSTTFLTHTTQLIDAAQHVRANWPGVPLIMGGPVLVELSKSVPARTLQSLLSGWGADAYVISALGEAAFLKLLSNKGKDLEELALPNTWIRRGKKFVKNEELEEPGLSIDENYVHWDILDQSSLYHTVHTRTARSCAFACSFCTFVVNQGPLTLSQPETLERELERLTASGNVKSIIFTDDTLNVPAPRFLELLKVLKKFDFEWYSYFRAQFADEDCAKAMAESGCKAVFLGIESLDVKVLKNMNKAASIKSYTRGLRALKKVGISTHVNLIIGFPGDVPSNTKAAIEWMDEEGVDFYTIGPFYCSPSTDIASEKSRQHYGLEGNFWHWKHDTMNSEQAHELETWAIENAKQAVYVSELTGQSFWSEVVLLSNGFSIDEVKEIISTFNRHSNRNQTLAAIQADPSFQRVQEILAGRELPPPPGIENYRTKAESREHCARSQIIR